MGPLEYVTKSATHLQSYSCGALLAGCFRSGRYAPSDRYLIRPPPSGCFQPDKVLQAERWYYFLAPVATLPPTAVLYALLRRAGSALRGLGLLVAPLLVRPAPRCSCMVVVIHKASIRYRNRYLPHPRTGEGSQLSNAFRRCKAVGFSGIFYALRAMPSKPTPLLPPPLATSVSVKASGCPSGITPEAFTETSFLLIGIDFVDALF